MDYVEFECRELLDAFLRAWRDSGVQRAGYLYGRYEPYDYAPLGIKAVVSAIYEPPQTGTIDGLELADDEQGALADAIAAEVGLQKVGWVITDLEADPTLPASANTKYKRFISDTTTVFTAGEVLQAAYQQVAHPNVVARKYSTSQQFGSKFVTVVVSGNEANEVAPTAFQATADAMAMAKAGILAPSTRDSNRMFVRPSDDELYVPEVYYVAENKYGKTVRTPAAPSFPSDYLHVQLEAGASNSGLANPLINHHTFPIENREAMGELQNMEALDKHISASEGTLLTKLSNFHVLLFLATNSTVPLKGDEFDALLKAVGSRDEATVDRWARESPAWATLLMLMAEQVTTTSSAASGSGFAGVGASSISSSGGQWQCPACTLLNSSSSTTCEACGMARP